MNSALETARGFAHQFLNYEKSKGALNISDERLKEIIDKVSAIDIDIVQHLDKDLLFEVLSADLSQGRGRTSQLSDGVIPWINNERSKISFQLWSRYKLYMEKKDPAFPINDLDDFTDSILDLCVNPKQPGSWDRRGMVVGHVQSGKTSNYVGLINKATDSGYKLIIVIAGTMNSLRRQTQQRIDEGYIGVNSSKGGITGVGEFPRDAQITSLTSSSIVPDGDFDQKTATRKGIPIGINPVVLVIKKNKGVLENLIDWLSANQRTIQIDGEYRLFDVPTLIIDDEADSASVNTVSKKKVTQKEALEEAKAINRLIRTLLNLFDQKTFIGYTATPYANLFIPEKWSQTLESAVKGKVYKVGRDLFPKDFIINIKAAKNYLGASAIFGYEAWNSETENNPLDIIRSVNLLQTPFVLQSVSANGEIILKSPKKDDVLPDTLPDSLREAIMAFILTCAIRRLRGHEKKHNSMLVHVMLFVRWIDWTAYLVNEELRKYKDYIAGKDSGFLEKLKFLFENDFKPTTMNIQENLNYTDVRIKEHSWSDVLLQLHDAVSKIEVRAVHGLKTNSDLVYKNIKEIDYEEYESTGLSVIAVGGSRLARGITLEGLSVSYYLRASKMYDTLMQMGRWFGYRPGYADLMRLYTTDTLTQWFNHIAMATEHMRNDFDELASLPGVTPGSFKLKVRNHSGLLAITAATKLFWSEVLNISFSGQNPQTYQLLKTSKSIANNFNEYEKFLRAMGKPTSENLIKLKNGKISHLVYKDVNIVHLTKFLDNYLIDQISIKNATLSEYITKQNLNDNIKGWNVVFRSNTEARGFISNGEKSSARQANVDTLIYSFRDIVSIGAVIRNQLLARDSDYYYISKNQIDDIGDRKIDLAADGLNKNEDIKKARSDEKFGLIILYLLDPRGTSNVESKVPFVGFSIHFPQIDREEVVSYTATTRKEVDFEQEDDDREEDKS